MAMCNNDAEPFADAIEMLKADHQRVRDLFQQYQAARDFPTKRHIAELVFLELETHAQLEEMVFYPAVEAETEEEGQELVEDAREEHQEVKALIAALRRTEEGEFDRQFQFLMTQVEYHVQEEEDAMFPLAEAALAEDTAELADDMQAAKQQILAS